MGRGGRQVTQGAESSQARYAAACKRLDPAADIEALWREAREWQEMTVSEQTEWIVSRINIARRQGGIPAEIFGPRGSQEVLFSDAGDGLVHVLTTAGRFQGSATYVNGQRVFFLPARPCEEESTAHKLLEILGAEGYSFRLSQSPAEAQASRETENSLWADSHPDRDLWTPEQEALARRMPQSAYEALYGRGPEVSQKTPPDPVEERFRAIHQEALRNILPEEAIPERVNGLWREAETWYDLPRSEQRSYIKAQIMDAEREYQDIIIGDMFRARMREGYVEIEDISDPTNPQPFWRAYITSPGYPQSFDGATEDMARAIQSEGQWEPEERILAWQAST